MSTAEWQKIKRIFQEAIELPFAERAAFLTEACNDDETRAEVESLLDYHESAQDFIEESAIPAAARVLADFGRGIETGQQIGRYRVVREISRGGMGVVYLAERDDVGSQVAIKILPNAFFLPAYRERFTTEQRTLARLNHQFIAQLYDADVLPDGTPWFAMEYVEGKNIIDHCRGRPIEECLKLFRQVCEAVRYAHGRMVIHRDIKPSNILVKFDDQTATPKLLDFGIAKHLEDRADDGHATVPELRMMTPVYAAPELFQGSGWFQADVYSLGMILYELLAGGQPFELSNRTREEIERIKADTEPETPSSRAKRSAAAAGSTPRLPRAGSWSDLDVLCLKAMHRDPDRRYGSVEALIGDIDRYLNSKPLEARPDSLSYKLGKFIKRHRAGVATAATVLVVIVSLAAFFTIRLTRARNHALSAAAQTRRVQSFMSNLLAGGDPAGPSTDLRVVTLLDRGQQLAPSLDSEPEVQAELYTTLGASYRKLGAVDKAEPLLTSALQRRQMLFGPDDPQVAESLIELGLLRLDQVKLDEAERLIRDGLEMIQRIEPGNKVALTRATTAMGRVRTARGNYDEAIRLLEAAVELQANPVTPTPELSEALTQLAEAHFYAGHYDISKTVQHRSLAIDRQIFGDHHFFVGHDLMNLAAIEIQSGHYKEAEQLYEQSLQIIHNWYKGDHPEVASNLVQLAQALTGQERYDEAERRLQEAVAMNERVLPKNHPRLSFALNELGSLAINRGKLDEAEVHFLRVSDINKAAYGDDHFRTITARSNLASVYYQRKDYVRAETMLREVVQGYAKISPDHVNTGSSRIKLARTLIKQTRFKEAEVENIAGYEILMKQASPWEDWLRDARKNFVEIYEGLEEPEKAAKYRLEQQTNTKIN